MTFGPLSSSPSDGGGPPYLAPCCAGETLTLAAEIPDAIARLIARRDGIADDAAARVEARLTELADLLGGAVREWLEAGGPDAVRGRALGMSLSDALGILDSLQADDGPVLAIAREEWKAALDELARLAVSTAGEAGLGVKGLDVEGWTQVQSGALQNAASAWDTKVRRYLAEATQRAAMEAVYVVPDVVGQRITEMVRDLTPQTVTEARTATAAYDRVVQAGLADLADPTGNRLRWVSVGPVDGLQRRFCALVSGKSFTREQVGRLRNGAPGMPVADFHGGYNCRHHWVQMPSPMAARMGYDAATDLDVTVINASVTRKR